jgi:pimeloyl-ACP methyl ester carboxylesterase
MPSKSIACAAFALVLAHLPAAAAAELRSADPGTRDLLRRAEFEQVALSPDGKLLAIARRSELGLDFLHRAVGTDAAELSAGSPAQRAAEIGVPVFLAHGRLDAIADIKFARAMESALNKGAGKRVDLVEYPYQGHGLVLADQREDFYARLLDFLRANLGAGAAGVATP